MRIRDFLGNALYKFTFYLLTYYLFSAPEIFIPGACDTKKTGAENRRQKIESIYGAGFWSESHKLYYWLKANCLGFARFFLHCYLLLLALTALNGLSRADVTRSLRGALFLISLCLQNVLIGLLRRQIRASLD